VSPAAGAGSAAAALATAIPIAATPPKSHECCMQFLALFLATRSQTFGI
jgi:hypothetical protein